MQSIARRFPGVLVVVIAPLAIAGCSGGAANRFQDETARGDTARLVSASSWMWRSPDPPRNELYAVHALSNSVAIAVGDAGAVGRSLDGGATWTAHWTGSVRPLRAGYFHDSAHGVVVGDSGAIYQTVDSGETWAARASGTTERLRGIAFADRARGLIVGTGGTMLRTSDAGASWTRVESGTQRELRSICFPDSQTGVAVGLDGIVLRSTDQGATLSQVVNGISQPPKNSVEISALAVTMFAYSAMKNSENFIAEYSEW